MASLAASAPPLRSRLRFGPLTVAALLVALCVDVAVLGPRSTGRSLEAVSR